MSFWGEYRRELDKVRRARALRTLGLSALLLATAATGFWFGRHIQGIDTNRLLALEDIRASQSQEQAQLRRELVGLQLEQRVNNEASSLLRTNLKQLDNEVTQLRDELVFYRSLMAPDKLAKGLQIADFELFEKRSGAFTFHLLLTQVAQRRSRLSGKVEVFVSGLREGQTEVLPLTELSQMEAYPLPYRFRYFQDIKGEIRLPAGFAPESVQVSVQARGKSAVERSFAWTESIARRQAG